MKNRSDKKMIRAFISSTEDLKYLGIHPGFHFMDNEASAALNMTMTTMNIKYQLFPPSNHRANNAVIVIQTFNSHFIVGMCRLDKDFHLQ